MSQFWKDESSLPSNPKLTKRMNGHFSKWESYLSNAQLMAELSRPNARTPSGDKNDLMFVITASNAERGKVFLTAWNISSSTVSGYVKKVSLFIFRPIAWLALKMAPWWPLLSLCNFRALCKSHANLEVSIIQSCLLWPTAAKNGLLCTTHKTRRKLLKRSWAAKVKKIVTCFRIIVR